MAHILVIDDDPLLRQLITHALEEAGHTVLRCENGRKAIAHLEHDDADLLITDVIMPEMDGIETVRAVRRLRPALPILAISGGGPGGTSHYLGMATAFGATAALPKPFRPLDLVALVKTLLAAPAQEPRP
jgi:CheY-like chemotaxis protein